MEPLFVGREDLLGPALGVNMLVVVTDAKTEVRFEGTFRVTLGRALAVGEDSLGVSSGVIISVLGLNSDCGLNAEGEGEWFLMNPIIYARSVNCTCQPNEC